MGQPAIGAGRYAYSALSFGRVRPSQADRECTTDWNTLETLSTTPPSLAPQIKAAQRRLPEQIKVQQEKEKDEVLGKLKDLGNMVLGKLVFCYPLVPAKQIR